MQQVIQQLKDNGYGFLATVDGDLPRVRPFGFMFGEGSRLYFCTNSTKSVYRQLIEQPMVEFASTSLKMVTVRITGKAVFTENREHKEKVLASSEMVNSLYKSADNPIFKVFYIEHGRAEITDFSGQPPRVLEF